MIYDSILDTIGNTPIVRIHRLAPKHVTLYARKWSSKAMTSTWRCCQCRPAGPATSAR